MSEDSSSEDDTERFKEAVDKHFLSEDLYNPDLSKEKKKSISEVIPSFRHDKPQIESHNPFSIKLTPEFQKHVAQHLDKKLEELIDDSEVFLQRKKFRKCKENTGVKLLSKSKSYLCVDNNFKKPDVEKSRKNSDKIFEERAKQVAVTPEWVLSQKETKHWAPCTKGEVEIIKVPKIVKSISGKQPQKK